MKFVIRDDDLSYFSKPVDVEKWYGGLFAMNIPVGFSTVPFLNPAKDNFFFILPEERRNKEFPISENKELIADIKNNHLIEIMQHGCTHEKFKDNFFEYMKKEGLEERTKKGKEELEKAFGKEIKIFVAPHDSFSNHALRAIEKNNLNIIRGKGCKNILFSFFGMAGFLKMAIHQLSFRSRVVARDKLQRESSFNAPGSDSRFRGNGRKNNFPAYPEILNLGKHKQAFSCRLDENLQNLKNNFLYAYKKNTYFVITAHLYTYNQEKKDKLLELIKFAKEKEGVQFVYPSELFY